MSKYTAKYVSNRRREAALQSQLTQSNQRTQEAVDAFLDLQQEHDLENLNRRTQSRLAQAAPKTTQPRNYRLQLFLSVLFFLIAVASIAATSAFLMSPILGATLGAGSLMCLTFCGGIIWERVMYAEDTK